MQPFDYVVPKDRVEASALLAAGNGTVRALMGGTDLLIRIRGGFVTPRSVVDLKGLPGMQQICQAQDGGLVIGAACTMNQVAGHPLVQERYDLLAQACNSVASYQIRNRATIGGNCCNASPAADTAPALYCLAAAAETFGPAGARRIPIAEFFTAPGRTALKPGEFLTALYLPPALTGATGVFAKLGRTRAGDISMVNAAVFSWSEGPDRSPETCRVCWRITLGAVGPTPLRAPQAEAALAADASPAAVERAAGLAAAAARPIDDIRAGAAYRRAMVKVLVRRAIEENLRLRAAQGRRGPDAGGAA